MHIRPSRARLARGTIVTTLLLSLVRSEPLAAAEPVPLKLGISEAVNTVLAIWMADAAGLYAKHNIKVTLSNMGGLGAGPFTPIINPPQVGILGVGKARMMPVYRDGQFIPRRVLQLCVAYDHRLVDGAIGARFTNEIAKALEDFQGTFLGL